MPKEPLTQTKKTGTKHGPGWRGVYAHKTYKSELTGRGKAKLEAQIKKAESIMRTESGTYGRERTDAYRQAKRMRDRAQKLLGTPSSPGKKQPLKTKEEGSTQEEIRRWMEKKVPGDPAGKMREVEKKTRAKAALVGVAKRANKA